MAERRELSFASLGEIMSDVRRLLEGSATVGQWSLGQIFNHLAATIRLTAEAPPSTAAPTPEQQAARDQFVRQDRFPEGRSARHPALIPRPGLDASAEAEALREAIATFATAPGPFPAHPSLGPLNQDEWTRFHCLHCAHHLGFAVPAPPV